MAMQLEYVHERLKLGNTAEWRFGSDLNGGEDNAKLFIWYEKAVFKKTPRVPIDKIIRFSFDPNLFSGVEAKKMRNDFEKEVDKLLGEWKVNIEL